MRLAPIAAMPASAYRRTRRSRKSAAILVLTLMQLCDRADCAFVAAAGVTGVLRVSSPGADSSMRSSQLMHQGKRFQVPMPNLRPHSKLGPISVSSNSVDPISFKDLSSIIYSSNWIDSSSPSPEEYDELLNWAAGTNDAAPPQCYDNLFQRFQNWANKFKTLKLNKVIDVEMEDALQDAFNQANQSLVDEECEPDDGSGQSGDSNGEQSNSESDQIDLDDNNWFNPNSKADFVYKILNKVVNYLDTFLKYSQIARNVMEKLNDIPEDETNEEKLRRSLELVKQEAINYAVNQSRIKVKLGVQQYGLDKAAQFMLDTLDYQGNPMTFLQPMLRALNSKSVSMLSEFIGNLQFRGALALINHVKPMPFTRCKPKDKQPEPYC